MCTAVYVFKHILYRAMFWLVFFQCSWALLGSFSWQAHNFNIHSLHTLHKLHQARAEKKETINYFQICVDLQLSMKREEKGKTDLCRLWGGRAQIVRSAFHFLFVLLSNTSWLVLNSSHKVFPFQTPAGNFLAAQAAPVWRHCKSFG